MSEYCQRIVKTYEDGRLPKLCLKRIDSVKDNPLRWCEGCRAHLPIWPANDPPAALTADHLEPA